MTLTGGKRKVNKSFKAWVAFVKRVQKEEKLSYKDAIHRAKVRKDKGEKWMVGGEDLKGREGSEVPEGRDATLTDDATIEGVDTVELNGTTVEGETPSMNETASEMEGGRRKTRRRRGSAKKSRKTKRRRTRRH